MLVLAINEGENVSIKLEDGRVIKVFVKVRRAPTKSKPGRVGVAVDAPKSIRIDHVKADKNEKEND